jgi:hypothetical protein
VSIWVKIVLHQLSKILAAVNINLSMTLGFKFIIPSDPFKTVECMETRGL